MGKITVKTRVELVKNEVVGKASSRKFFLLSSSYWDVAFYLIYVKYYQVFWRLESHEYLLSVILIVWYCVTICPGLFSCLVCSLSKNDTCKQEGTPYPLQNGRFRHLINLLHFCRHLLAMKAKKNKTAKNLANKRGRFCQPVKKKKTKDENRWWRFERKRAWHPKNVGRSIFFKNSLNFFCAKFSSFFLW